MKIYKASYYVCIGNLRMNESVLSQRPLAFSVLVSKGLKVSHLKILIKCKMEAEAAVLPKSSYWILITFEKGICRPCGCEIAHQRSSGSIKGLKSYSNLEILQNTKTAAILDVSK
jgi:hypothetical protein